MKRFLPVLALTAFASGASFSAVPASAAIETLAQCYDLVINHCNANSSHPQACASNGMDQCDEQFPTAAAGGSRPLSLIAPDGRPAPGALASRLRVIARN